MSEPPPNDAQRELIEGTEGPYLVDAAPGTGRTFAVTRRYRRIADRVGDQTLRQIGRSIPTNAEWPPGVDGPLAGLGSLDEAYQPNHPGGGIGSVGRPGNGGRPPPPPGAAPDPPV